MKQLHSLPLLVLILSLLAFAGCATTKISDERKAEISTIQIINENGNELKYLKFGTTVFQNSDVQPVDMEAIPAAIDFLKDELENRGYTVVSESDSADAILRIDPVTNPSVNGVEGIGFFIHTMFGMNFGVQLQANLCFRVVDPMNGNQIGVSCTYEINTSEIKKAEKQWEDLSAEDRAELLTLMETFLRERFLHSLDELGL